MVPAGNKAKRLFFGQLYHKKNSSSSSSSSSGLTELSTIFIIFVKYLIIL